MIEKIYRNGLCRHDACQCLGRGDFYTNVAPIATSKCCYCTFCVSYLSGSCKWRLQGAKKKEFTRLVPHVSSLATFARGKSCECEPVSVTGKTPDLR